MNMKKIRGQFKREFWENKTGFFVMPLIVTGLLLVMMIFSVLYMGDKLSTLDHKFQMEYSNSNNSGEPDEKSLQLNGNPTQLNESSAKPNENAGKTEAYDFFDSAAKDQSIFGNMLVASIQINSLFLAVAFFITLLGYSHRCLFDDRKNRDILFWRSLPVSETTNVIVKLATAIFIAPLVILALNICVWIICFLIGIVLFTGHGIALGYLIASVISNINLWIVFHVFFITTLGTLALMPVIGFILCASAFAKKSPFFTSSLVPVLLVIADKTTKAILGINLHIEDALYAYSRFWLSINSAFNPVEGVGVSTDVVMGFLISAIVGSVFIAMAIWLRNYRYEI